MLVFIRQHYLSFKFILSLLLIYIDFIVAVLNEQTFGAILVSQKN